MLIFFLIFLIISILILNVSVSIHNKDKENYVKIKVGIITVKLEYLRFSNLFKNIDLNFLEQIKLINTINPAIMKILSILKIKKLHFEKYFSGVDKTYQVITFYLFSSYLNSFLKANTKYLKEYKYNSIFGTARDDLDFTLDFNVRIISLIVVFIKNIKIFNIYFKRRALYGS